MHGTLKLWSIFIISFRAFTQIAIKFVSTFDALEILQMRTNRNRKGSYGVQDMVGVVMEDRHGGGNSGNIGGCVGGNVGGHGGHGGNSRLVD